MKIGIALLLFCGAALADCHVGGGTANGWEKIPVSDSLVAEASCDVFHNNIELAVGNIGEWKDRYNGVQRFTVDAYQYGSAVWLVRWPMTITPFLGAGVMARTNSDGIENILPRWWNYSLTFGVEWNRLRVQYRHFSNASGEDSNRGQNALIVSWGFGGTK